MFFTRLVSRCRTQFNKNNVVNAVVGVAVIGVLSGCDVLNNLGTGTEPFFGIEPARGEPSPFNGLTSVSGLLNNAPVDNGQTGNEQPSNPLNVASGDIAPDVTPEEVAEVTLPPEVLASREAFQSTVYPFLREHCSRCHSAEEAGMLPFHADVNKVVAYQAARKMVYLANPSESRLVIRLAVDRHNCPQSMSCAEAAADLTQRITAWAATINVSQPEQPGLNDPVLSTDVIAAIETDRAGLSPEARERVAYVSLHTAYNEGATERELDLYRVGISKSLNLIARYAPAIVNPTAIDARRLIYRINVDDYWSGNRADAQTIWARLMAGPRSDLNLGANAEYIEACQLGYSASRPGVYNDIMELPFFASLLELELGVNKTKGIDSYQFFTVGNAVSINENDRVVWLGRTKDDRQYWRSFDAFSFLNPELFRNPILEFTPDVSAPIRVVGSAAEIIFELPNGLDGYYIAGAGNQKREDAFTFVVCDPERGGPCFDREPGQEDLRLINGASCIDCHEDGMKYMYDELTPAIAEGKLTFSEAEKARIAELYPGQAFLDAALREGRERFQGAMAQIIGSMAVDPDAYVRIDEPVNALSRCAMKRYDYPMTTSN